MANVVNRTTVEVRYSVNTPDYPVEDWIINPDLSALASVPNHYWKVVGDSVVEMDAGEKAAVDAAMAAAALAEAKTSAKDGIDGNGGYDLRAVAKLMLDEVNMLRQWLASFKTEVAAAANLADLKTRVAGLPATPDRTLLQAKAAYKNLIDGSGLDE